MTKERLSLPRAPSAVNVSNGETTAPLLTGDDVSRVGDAARKVSGNIFAYDLVLLLFFIKRQMKTKKKRKNCNTGNFI